MDIEIKPIDRIVGEVQMPGDKSISHRVAMVGSLSNGQTRAGNFLTGEDCMHTVEAFKKMQVEINISNKSLIINGVGLRGLKKVDAPLYLGNSGTTMRLLAGILAGQNFQTILTGDESLSRRPMERIIKPLTLMGTDITSLNNNGCAPLKIKGGNLKSIEYKTEVASAQVKSCILLAGLYADGETIVSEAFQSRDHTERMLAHFGANIRSSGITNRIKSGAILQGKKIFIPGDISSAAFFIILTLITEGSELEIRSLSINPTRRKIIDILLRMGADIKIENEKNYFEPIADLKVRSSRLKGISIKEDEIPQIIDEIPILSVACLQAEGESLFSGVGELKVKETDRVFSVVDNLKKIGGDINSKDNSLYIKGRRKRFSIQKKGQGALNSYGDHRTAMAMCIAAAYSSENLKITDIDCINTSFPEFFDIFNYLQR